MYPAVRKECAKTHMIQNQYKEIEYLTFPELSKMSEIRHLFSTRLGGVSKDIFASMNLSFTRGDEAELVFENFQRIAEIFSKKAEDFVFSDQTHTTNVYVASKKDAGAGICKERSYHDIDALITNEKGIILSTFYADCVPVFLVDPTEKAIGLCHSGWKGTVGKISKKAIEAMQQEFGCKPENIHAAIAPSICMDCYEVSEDVILAFRDAFCERDWEKLFYQKENGKYQLDLWKACELTLIESGILERNIEITDICTCENPDYLFSHRASHGKRGNLGAFLMLTE